MFFSTPYHDSLYHGAASVIHLSVPFGGDRRPNGSKFYIGLYNKIFKNLLLMNHWPEYIDI